MALAHRGQFIHILNQMDCNLKDTAYLRVMHRLLECVGEAQTHLFQRVVDGGTGRVFE